ncbi:MAG: hypothetical protein LBP33_01850 [Candidatus Adiutrix sp.]|jgi:hypothetical protein|nr:hypothetical protein [Candidatus Adiutrix sp.]
MMKANTGSSVNVNARTAGLEAAGRAGQGLDQINLAFIYASSDYELDEMLQGAREALPGVPFIGGTSYRGLILPEGLISGRRFVGVLALSDPDLTVGVAAAHNRENDDTVAVGREAALAAMKKAGRTDPPDYFHLASSASLEEDYLLGISEAIGRKPVFGASAADNEIMGDWRVFTDQELVGDGLAVAVFYSDRPLVNHFSSEPYRELEERCVIKKMIGQRKLVEVEGSKSLLQRIIERDNLDPDFLAAADLQMSVILDPVGVKDRLGRLTSLAFPMYLNPDGSIDFGSNLSEGDMAIHMQARLEDLPTAGGQELEVLKKKMNGQAAAYHLAMGFGRAMIMRADEIMGQAADLICRAADGVPFIMAFTLTECGFVADGANTCANLMLSYSGFPR